MHPALTRAAQPVWRSDMDDQRPSWFRGITVASVCDRILRTACDLVGADMVQLLIYNPESHGGELIRISTKQGWNAAMGHHGARVPFDQCSAVCLCKLHPP